MFKLHLFFYEWKLTFKGNKWSGDARRVGPRTKWSGDARRVRPRTTGPDPIPFCESLYGDSFILKGFLPSINDQPKLGFSLTRLCQVASLLAKQGHSFDLMSLYLMFFIFPYIILVLLSCIYILSCHQLFTYRNKWYNLSLLWFHL